MAKTQDYGLGEFTFPRGWFMVAAADELQDGKPLPLRFFNREFALYRGGSGKLVLLDAYCPHMGTHLARNTTSYTVRDGQIEGDSIRCPYHAWRFGPDGKCDHIPYSSVIPKAASVRAWPAVETMGCIYVWYDEEGGEPEYQPPSFPEWNDPQWVQWKIDHLGTIDCHPQEIVDNIADLTHLGPIHGSTVEYFENEFRGHLAIQRQGGGHRTLVSGSSILETDTWYTGPGILYSRVKGLYDAIMYIAHTPVEDGTIRGWHALLVKSANETALDADIASAREYQEASRLAFLQDFEIWANKRPCLQPLQLPTDGPFHKARAWYKQFYNKRERTAELQKNSDGVYQVKGMPSQPKVSNA